MKIFSCIIFTLFTCLLAAGSQQEQPRYMEKQFVVSAENAFFRVTVPSDWELDRDPTTEDESYFIFSDSFGKVRCTIEIQPFKNEADTEEELTLMKEQFYRIEEFTSGFKVKMKTSACIYMKQGRFMIQVWYFFGKDCPWDETVWQKLENCIERRHLRHGESKESLEKAFELANDRIRRHQEVIVEEIESIEPEVEPAIEIEETVIEVETPTIVEETRQIEDTKPSLTRYIPKRGWICYRPESKQGVLLQSKGKFRTKANTNKSMTYLLEVEDRNCTGFFYILWNQVGTNQRPTHEAFLGEMKDELLKNIEGQAFEKKITFHNQRKSIGSLKGTPYSLITVEGDGFLFGFALKQTRKLGSYDPSRLISRVQYWVEE